MPDSTIPDSTMCNNFHTRSHSRLSSLLPVFAVVLAAIGMTACGGSEPVSDQDSVPDWYTETPDDPNHVFSSQSATSQRMQVAVDKATTSARGDVASKLETQVEGMSKSFTEEIGDDMRQQFVETQKTVTSRVLRGTNVSQKEILQKDNGTYQAFVLMEMPIGKAAKEMMSKIKQNDEMYTRFRSSQAFKEMQKAVEEYEQEQQQGMTQRSQPQEEEDGGNQNR
ncbi:hypothetical protein GGP72_003223 [Salinibacter ruber]|uniref:Lipoprotein n=2 Tax=Salinibacter ruber TaxID=146919 RepID=A0A9X2TFP8_9BACT|nr:hypothetical protein [Salinibacter ruber]MCS3679274.1 hypothetical protein [Salinibacter ruber]MCS3682560.1 hypothetical protein [Salinibacter ruber]